MKSRLVSLYWTEKKLIKKKSVGHSVCKNIYAMQKIDVKGTPRRNLPW